MKRLSLISAAAIFAAFVGLFFAASANGNDKDVSLAMDRISLALRNNLAETAVENREDRRETREELREGHE